jgi:hypothetical protein
VEPHPFSRRRIHHHHLLGYFKHGNAIFPLRKNRTTHNSEAVETKRFLRTGEARSRSTNLKARGTSDCVATMGVSQLGPEVREAESPLHLQRFIA